VRWQKKQRCFDHIEHLLRIDLDIIRDNLLYFSIPAARVCRPLDWCRIRVGYNVYLHPLKGNAMTTLSKRLCLSAILALSTFAFAATASAETSKLVIESGDSAQSRQNAAMDKEQWNDTRNLRQKVNKRTEKEWDKEDVAFDARDKCQQSANVNAYWEPNTLRCLDRRTGRTVAP
jgi:hypothetical protein